jgi:hypothetical protein
MLAIESIASHQAHASPRAAEERTALGPVGRVLDLVLASLAVALFVLLLAAVAVAVRLKPRRLAAFKPRSARPRRGGRPQDGEGPAHPKPRRLKPGRPNRDAAHRSLLGGVRVVLRTLPPLLSGAGAA